MPVQAETVNEITNFRQELISDLEQNERALQEITLMLEQSQTELNKLTQRNALITGQLQQIQVQIESLPRADIRMAYNNAMESQQRLMVMRGQLEKLQSDQTHLLKFINLQKRIQKNLGEESGFGAAKKKSSGSAILELVVKAQEAERQRLSRQMHDGPAQALSNFIVQTEIATRLFDLDANRAKDELGNLKIAAMSTFQKVRTFIFELRPMSLDDLGLFPTVKRYVDAFKDQTGAEVTLALRGPEQRYESYLEVMIFRALQELMGNAARHNLDAPNKIHINVGVAVEDNLFKVSVSDNGKGFDPQETINSEGVGLKLIRERVEIWRLMQQPDREQGSCFRCLA
jgi:two-component system sensor histidine kinase DegS